MIPGKPTGQGRPRTAVINGRARIYKDQASRSAEAEIAWLIRHAAGPIGAPGTGYVAVLIEVFLPVPESWPRWKREMALAGDIRPAVKPDVDNVAKSIADGMTKSGLIRDDAQVSTLLVERRYAQTPPETSVAIFVGPDRPTHQPRGDSAARTR